MKQNEHRRAQLMEKKMPYHLNVCMDRQADRYADEQNENLTHVEGRMTLTDWFGIYNGNTTGCIKTVKVSGGVF